MEKTANSESPSAPPLEVDPIEPGLRDTRRIEHENVLQAPPIYNPQSSSTSSAQSSANQAPPPYQEAVNYPKPQSNEQIYPPAPYPSYPHYNATGGAAAPAAYIIQTTVPPQPTVTVIASGNCAFCLNGRVEPETDLCCLLCLIVLAIFTFPFGLVLLCCIPCTTRRRCLRCRRLNG